MKRTLDWRPRHDPRSREYPARTLVPRAINYAHRNWRAGQVLDQGAEGACVGFAWAGELAASPAAVRRVDNAYARGIYNRARMIDEWPGEAYEGTSVLAGAKVCHELGLIDEYRWAFSIEDVRDTLLTIGPVVLGIWWYDSMYETRPSGLVEVSGTKVGGHAIMVTGYYSNRLFYAEGLRRYEVFRWQNSWGISYGRGGQGYIRAADLAALLADQGEACVPLVRRAYA